MHILTPIPVAKTLALKLKNFLSIPYNVRKNESEEGIVVPIDYDVMFPEVNNKRLLSLDYSKLYPNYTQAVESRLKWADELNLTEVLSQEQIKEFTEIDRAGKIRKKTLYEIIKEVNYDFYSHYVKKFNCEVDAIGEKIRDIHEKQASVLVREKSLELVLDIIDYAIAQQYTVSHIIATAGVYAAVLEYKNTGTPIIDSTLKG